MSRCCRDKGLADIKYLGTISATFSLERVMEGHGKT